jgi:hypothetical protein
MPRAKQGRAQGVVATPDLGGVAGGSSGSFTALGRFARRADGWLPVFTTPGSAGAESIRTMFRVIFTKTYRSSLGSGRAVPRPGSSSHDGPARCVSASDPRHGRPVRVEVVGDGVSVAGQELYAFGQPSLFALQCGDHFGCHVGDVDGLRLVQARQELLNDPGRQSGFEQSFDLQHDVYV